MNAPAGDTPISDARSPVCETARLRLLPLSLADAPFIVELLNDAEFIRNIGDRAVRTTADACHYIATGPRASYEKLGFGLYLVEQRQTRRPVGICGLLRRDSHPDVELGFAFIPAGRGHGYATEASRAVLEHGRDRLRLGRVVALTAPENRDSMHVLEKLGFRYAGQMAAAPPRPPSNLFMLQLQGASA